MADQDARTAQVLGAGCAGEPVQDGQRKCAGLARAGLGDAQHVAAGHELGNRARLDRRRHGMVARGKRTLNRIGKAESRKVGNVHLSSFAPGGAHQARGLGR